MQDREQSLSSTSSKRAQLPPLAPRQAQPASNVKQQTRESGSERPPRPSHRSRAGCWTCRARKVKCDELKPKCGPCTRLNRDCDWDHRWNFSDATTNTLIKYGNVSTNGSAVWDPIFRASLKPSPVALEPDTLPPFSVLTTDEERERKAESQQPGTFGIVVTPESFAVLPEYVVNSSSASRRASVQSNGSSFCDRTSPIGHALTRVWTDPNIVILDRFEDVSSPSTSLFSLPSPARRPSLPNGMQHISISATTPTHIPALSLPQPERFVANDPLLDHFQHYVLSRLVLSSDTISGFPTSTSTMRSFQAESTSFPPLYHAMCAISALNLAYSNISSLETALQHYHQALSVDTAGSDPNDLISNGSFLRHFLLLVYDICTYSHDDHGENMLAIHLGQLQRLTILRYERHSKDPLGFINWCICELDVHACLMGSGDCQFVRTLQEYNTLPLLHEVISETRMPLESHYHSADAASVTVSVGRLYQGILLQTAELAQCAQRFRRQASGPLSVSPGTVAQWQSTIAALQADMKTFWAQSWPKELDQQDASASHQLSPRTAPVLEKAGILHHAATIYSQTSMFPGQRRIPVAYQQEVDADIEHRVMCIISIAITQLEACSVEKRHVVFPLFMAGFATRQADVKIQALDIIRRLETTGIAQNTYRTRQLLSAVYEEQRLAADSGGRMEDIEWLAVAKERSLMVVNCGL